VSQPVSPHQSSSPVANAGSAASAPGVHTPRPPADTISSASPTTSSCWESFVDGLTGFGRAISAVCIIIWRAICDAWNSIINCFCPSKKGESAPTAPRSEERSEEMIPYTVSAEQKKIIYTMVTTVARYPHPSLWEKAVYLIPLLIPGRKVHVMHPFKLFEEMLNRRELRSLIPGLMRASTIGVCLEILFGMLERRYQAGDLNRHVDQFCAAVGVDRGEVQRIIEGRAKSDEGSNYWMALINFLVANLNNDSRLH
jgi:hypothetical protein